MCRCNTDTSTLLHLLCALFRRRNLCHSVFKETMTNTNGRIAATRSRSDSKGRPIENRLLLSAPDREFEVLSPHLELVTMGLHQILQDTGRTIDHGFFPNNGLVSLLIVTGDAKSVEVGMVGNEGFIGTPLAAGIRDSGQRVIVQAAGDAFRVKSEVLQHFFLKCRLCNRD